MTEIEVTHTKVINDLIRLVGGISKTMVLLSDTLNLPTMKYLIENMILEINTFKEYEDATFKIYMNKIEIIETITSIIDFEKYKNLKYFKCRQMEFACELPIPSINFGNLTHFICDGNINFRINSFGNLKHFECGGRIGTISSFDNLEFFKCNNFSQHVGDFGKLKHFECPKFNHLLPSCGFGELKRFICDEYNQPFSGLIEDWASHFIDDGFPFEYTFGTLEYFKCNNFNQQLPKNGFGKLQHFESAKFNKELPGNGFGDLKKFICESFSQTLTQCFAELIEFRCDEFKSIKYLNGGFQGGFEQLESFTCNKFNHILHDSGFEKLIYFNGKDFNQPLGPNGLGKLEHFSSEKFQFSNYDMSQLKYVNCPAMKKSK